MSAQDIVFDCFWRFITHPAMLTPIATTRINIVANALISGEIPNLTLEKISIGRVVAPGPDTKLEITKSSRERVNASNHPETIAGKIIGRVISHITLAGLAPRSIAASSNDSLISVNRDWIITAT